MKTLRPWIGPCAAILLLWGCGAGEETPLEVADFVPMGVSGILQLEEGEIRFQPCDADAFRTLEDGTGGDFATIPERLETGGGPVYAHLVLDGDRALEIRSAFPEGWGCPDVLPDTELQARGNEPFWGIDIDGDRALYRTPEDIDGTPFHDGRWSETDDGWRFEAGPDLVVRITSERCYDTMSGAWYPFAATATVGETEYVGCALEGRPFSAPGPGG